MADVELLHITADTTIKNFRDEVRWNSAYYRLAQGL
jgi:L-arabinose isomerase